jgi:hypothetical protein
MRKNKGTGEEAHTRFAPRNVGSRDQSAAIQAKWITTALVIVEYEIQ